jgi:hypothetical protein
MVTTFPTPGIDDKQDERQAQLISWLATAGFTILLFLVLWLIVIRTPIPAIPPAPEAMTLEIGLNLGTGGDAVTQGGGSSGNTGTPGMQQPADAANVPSKPSDNGVVTDPNSDNASASNSNHTSPTDGPKVDAATLAAMANWKKNKGAASINVGGDGKGDPYTGGLGDGSGSDKGLGDGDPGVNGPGGQNGTATHGTRVRHILSKPEIINPTQTEGKVVVNVYVDRTGKVKKAEVSSVGTTTMNTTLRATATQSAYKITFDADPSGPELLLLPIDIYFTLK